MINSTSSSDRAARTDSVPPVVIKAPVARPSTDNFSAANTAALKTALGAQPEIRPEVVARGRALAADPSYPSNSILQAVGAKLLNSPDLSDDQA